MSCSLYHQVLLTTLCLASLASPSAAQTDALNRDPKDEPWRFVQNEHLRIGVKVSSGAAIGWISPAASDHNVVNHFDRGRLIQQSYYGDADGSMWGEKPWNWNPVQGGHYQGRGARVRDLTNTQTTLDATSIPVHWATGDDLPNCEMQQSIKLQDHIARIRYRFSYTGTHRHSVREQEIPAVFLEPEYQTLVCYGGSKAWAGEMVERTQPGWPNERRKLSEPWAAYVNDAGWGLGVLVPGAKELTCYRFGDGRREHGACSYFAPVTRFAITPGLVWEYEVFITLGTIDEIRRRFEQIVRSPDHEKPKF